MARRDTVHPWQQIEEQAFHGFREWPLWLVLRQRELAQQAGRPAAHSPTAAKTDPSTEQPQRD
jgi:hypothetical protein